jgi:hypothetical protein
VKQASFQMHQHNLLVLTVLQGVLQVQTQQLVQRKVMRVMVQQNAVIVRLVIGTMKLVLKIVLNVKLVDILI